jgi:hypothetical protein
MDDAYVTVAFSLELDLPNVRIERRVEARG